MKHFDKTKTIFQRAAAVFVALTISAGVLAGCGGKYDAYYKISPIRALELFKENVPMDHYKWFADEMYSANYNGKYVDPQMTSEQAADKVFEQMNKIGLSGVVKESVPVASYSASHASITYTEEDNAVVLSCAVLAGTKTFTKVTEMLYCGSGTLAEYGGKEVADKAVLLILEKRDDTLKYAIETARALGAAAVAIAFSSESGAGAEFSESYKTASQTPVLSLGYDTAVRLQTKIAANGGAPLMVSMRVDSTADPNAEAFNVVGTIPGYNPDSYVILTADYDSLINGYNDSAASVAVLLGMAEAFIKSGYVFQRTIVFVAYGCPDAAIADSGYADNYGPFYQITTTHPEWRGNSLNVDICAPSVRHGNAYPLAVSGELESWINGLRANEQVVAGAYGSVEVTPVTDPGSRGYVFESLGIPTITLDYSRSDFSQYRNTAADTPQLFSEAYYYSSFSFYAGIVLAYESCAVIPTNYAAMFERYGIAGEEGSLLEKNKNSVISAATSLNYYVELINNEYAAAVSRWDFTHAKNLLDMGKAIDAERASLMLRLKNALFALVGSERVFKYDYISQNAALFDSAMASVESGKYKEAANRLAQVDGWANIRTYSGAAFSAVYEDINEKNIKKASWSYANRYCFTDFSDELTAFFAKSDSGEVEISEELAALAACGAYLKAEAAAAAAQYETALGLFLSEAGRLIDLFEETGLDEQIKG